jgi:hypothetical protein
MTEAQTALSRRVVACKGWRWMPGTLRLRATPPSRRDHLKGEGRVPDGGDPWVYVAWPVIPDLTDPATLGCLLALVREAWGQDDLVAFRFDGQWCAEVTPQEGQHHAFYGASEAEALAAALEAAP